MLMVDMMSEVVTLSIRIIILYILSIKAWFMHQVFGVRLLAIIPVRYRKYR